ncbi:hypothetical protein BGX38DRAFT_1244480 [Terfezia claveryi]|nr:hypothetical protein BGX38DRAFT_1244480 [Terfezia claveryi]
MINEMLELTEPGIQQISAGLGFHQSSRFLCIQLKVTTDHMHHFPTFMRQPWVTNF